MDAPVTLSTFVARIPIFCGTRPTHLYTHVRTHVYAHVYTQARLVSDAVRTFAYGTDASFYRLNPKLVVKVDDESEVYL